MSRQLLLGCGHSRDRRVSMDGATEFTNLTTLDISPRTNPDFIWDLEKYPWPFEPNTFDEVHAYEVLEHLGRQGDYLSFFKCFSEIWHILKPNGLLCATCPSMTSRWAWGDPGHTRIIAHESLVFLDQCQYISQLDGVNKTPMTDYRNIYKADFAMSLSQDDGESFRFILTAVKPSRAHA